MNNNSIRAEYQDEPDLEPRHLAGAVRRSAQASSRALDALHQFHTLGKAELPEPAAKYRRLPEVPTQTHQPIVKAEPIIALLAEIGQRDKRKFQ